VAFTSYGEQSKRQRRLLHKALGRPTIPSYHPLVQSGTHNLLRRILSDPSDFFNHVRRYSGSITLSVIYGYEPAQSNDQFIDMAEDCVNILTNEIASGGGIWPVDVIPSLQYLPKWMPGAGFLRKAEVWKKKMEDFVDLPYEFVKNALVSHYMRLLDRYGEPISTEPPEIRKLQAFVLFYAPRRRFHANW
jgi:cytochrome P450